MIPEKYDDMAFEKRGNKLGDDIFPNLRYNGIDEFIHILVYLNFRIFQF